VLNQERRRAIIEILERDGRVLVTDMARKFDTSQVTIRKDLEVLHAHGLVHRTHGAALPSREGALADPTLREKEKLRRREKLRIAASAAARVQEGQVVILDSGTDPGCTLCVPNTFFTCAFADPESGSFGDVSRNSVQGPGYQSWNFALNSSTCSIIPTFNLRNPGRKTRSIRSHLACHNLDS